MEQAEGIGMGVALHLADIGPYRPYALEEDLLGLGVGIEVLEPGHLFAQGQQITVGNLPVYSQHDGL